MGRLIEVTLPDFGDNESAPLEAIVSFWPVAVNGTLIAGSDLLEVVTDKASFIVPSPCSGILREQRVREEEHVRIGDVIAVIEIED